jgi:dihydroorotase
LSLLGGKLNNDKIAIINGKLFINNAFKKGCILIEKGKIQKVIFKNVKTEKIKNYNIINANKCLISYGFFDPHVHFRCPGNENKEDWDSGSRAALKGGYTYVLDMPNNIPPASDVETLILKNGKAKNSLVNYGFYLGLTDENSGFITEIMDKLKDEKIPIYGIKVFLGSSTGSLLVKKSVSLTNSLSTGVLNLFHCEDEAIISKYSNIPYNSIFDHNKKRPPEAEVSALEKIILAINKNKKNTFIYICHVSSGKLLKAIEYYKRKGFKIISEITPHHLFFSQDDIVNSNIYKVNPPIRSYEDVKILRKYFNKGFFEIIGTDHAPHLLNEKISHEPPSGFPGLESSFYALYSLYEKRSISLKKIFILLTSGYLIFNIINKGKLCKGYDADITIIKKEPNIFKVENVSTKAKYSPFDNLKIGSKIYTVLINGKVVLNEGKLVV